MHSAPDPPVLIQQLLRNSHFMEHIRAYNQMFLMTSFGEKIDDLVNKGRGPYVFKIFGQIYHWIGSLFPEEGHHPRFLQLYIYDTQDELNNKMHHFGGPNEGTLNPEIVKGFKIRLYNIGGMRGYELPTSDILGGIVFESGPRSRIDFDVIIEFRVEQSRLDYIHKHQNDLRSDYLSGLYDAVSRGDHEGITAGSKIMLPSTFIGGPRSNREVSTSTAVNSVQIDEIQDYVGGRFICLFEACWRIYDFPIHGRELAMQILNVYLEDMQRVSFRERDMLDIIVNLPEKKKITLTEWFVYNNEHTDGRHLTYLNFPSEFMWRPFLLPDAAISPERISGSSTEIRTLFAQILIYCDVADPGKLWTKHWQTMRDDIPTKVSKAIGIPNYHVNTAELQGSPPQHLLEDLKNKLLMEEKNYKRDLLMQEVIHSVPKLNHDQKKKIYDLIINASATNQQELLFIYGHGGTGKTFLWKKIISSLRSQGKIVLAVASSGIASLLLPTCRTTHSRFKLPLELTDESLCHAKKKSQNNAIQANMDINNIDYFNPLLKPGTVYRFSNFIYETTNPYHQTLVNKVSLKFGKITRFDILTEKESEFPEHHFEFIAYNQLASKVPYQDENSKMIYPVLTGCIRSNNNVTPFGDANTGQKYLRKVDIENLDGNIVEFTMWDELVKQFNKAKNRKDKSPVIIVVSSCRVTKYKATPATYYYINPRIPKAEYAHTA
ncbi:DNA helicase, partial [Tanacetum coccineum]